MKLSEAASKGITRVRRDVWTSPTAYLKIFPFKGGLGPWMHLYDRRTQEAINAPTPQYFLRCEDSGDDYVEYTGDTDRDDTDLRLF